MSTSSDAVFVRGLEFEGNHGVSAAERRGTRRFRVDLELTRSLADAARSDRLGDTLDYGVLCEVVLSLGTKSTFKLLEALASSMIDAIQARYPTAAVVLTLEKLAPPCPGVPEACGVRLTRPALS